MKEAARARAGPTRARAGRSPCPPARRPAGIGRAAAPVFGAQQRLVALSLELRVAQGEPRTCSEEADELLEEFSQELAQAITELRELAQGIHPAVLTEGGLGPALEVLAARAPLQALD